MFTWRLRAGLALALGAVAGGTANAAPAVAAPTLAIVGLTLSELLLGAALGLGVRVVLAGLDLAAAVIEGQLGLAASGDSWAGGHEATGVTRLLGWLGIAVWLTLPGLSGDLRLIQGLLESFRALPPGTLQDVAGPASTLPAVLSTALRLGLQVAAPVIVATGLTQLAWAWAARLQGGAAWHPPLAPVRLALGTIVLLLSMATIGEQTAATLSGGP